MTAEVSAHMPYPDKRTGKDVAIKNSGVYEFIPSHCEDLLILQKLFEKYKIEDAFSIHRKAIESVSKDPPFIDKASFDELVKVLIPENNASKESDGRTVHMAYLTIGLIVEVLIRDFKYHRNGNSDSYTNQELINQSRKKEKTIESFFCGKLRELDTLRKTEASLNQRDQLKTQVIFKTPNLVTEIDGVIYDLYQTYPEKWLFEIVKSITQNTQISPDTDDPYDSLNEEEKLLVDIGFKKAPPVSPSLALRRYMHHKIKSFLVSAAS